MKKVIPNIAVENCVEALDYYQEIFGGEIKNLQKANLFFLHLAMNQLR